MLFVDAVSTAESSHPATEVTATKSTKSTCVDYNKNNITLPIITIGTIMRAPFTQLYLHCVWATWDRLPLITPLNEQPIYAAIQSKCQELKCFVLAIGGTSDHIHLFVRFPTTIAVADLVKEVKGTSSHLVTHQINVGEFFKWQGAYGAFTVTKNLVPDVRAYIERQKQHHAENDLWPEWEQTVSEE